MAKVHRSYRLDEGLIARVGEWAEAHDMSATQAMEELLARALDGTEAAGGYANDTTLKAENEALREQRDILREYLATTKESLSTLAAQLAEKDRQMARLQDIAEHAQMLEAAHVAGAIAGDVAHDVSHDGTQDETRQDAQPRGIWAWLARKIDGR